ncbi:MULTISPECIES: hypothetical protein [Euryhalocaulis]|uniref:hypothetical protein n=1 Tax=Euryhalocaulis TaxID=1712422 RepID=UPI0003A8FA84|nr:MULTISPECIES: hypothetical protein [Euryhalocaulis]MBA4801974.1 hypothetical protein [Euryhalocaulis sp.]
MTPEIERALAYPFAPPRRSYVFSGGEAVFDDDPGFREALNAAMAVPRVAILASGSNASPTRLMEKFGGEAVVPTLRAELKGYAVVHSAKFTRYGAMPATFHPHQSATARVFVNLLDAGQLDVMDGTEALGHEYDRVDAPFPETVEHGAKPDRYEAYISRFGALRAGEGAAASAAADQDAPGLKVMSQEEAILHAMDVLEIEETLPDFVQRVIDDAAFRDAQNAQLKRLAALPFGAAGA